MESERVSGGARLVRETLVDESMALVHDAWRGAFPWLVQGTTTKGGADEPLDFGLSAGPDLPDRAKDSWRALLASTGMTHGIQGRQVHGRDVSVHRAAPSRVGATPVQVVGPCDAHVTAAVGVLLAVTIADCVPVFLVEPERRVVAVVHAGWRGVAAGVVESALESLTHESGVDASGLHLHLGPAICGRCYEVGPEVFAALGQPSPATPTPIDLRAILEGRAAAAGVASARTTVSTHCTRCTRSGLYSHRAGDSGRQVGYIGVRA